METVWYMIVSLMLSIYVVLDGFDFGAGILHLYVARTDKERRQVLNAIGPFWNGNEVWLIAAGGLLVFAFPHAYAAGFSGFYLPLMVGLWLLILRGISIEFRSKEDNPLWRTFWDSTFCLSSTFMTIVLGAALGNVIRGVPLDATGYFDGALFTDFQPGKTPGVLDWYTTAVGIFALLILAGHGALFLCWKTTDTVSSRSYAVAKVLWPIIFGFSIVMTYLTNIIRPELYQNLLTRHWTWLFAIIIACASVLLIKNVLHKNDLKAFICSIFLILGILGATAAGMYPNMLISSLNPAYNVTAINAATNGSTLQTGLIWFLPAVFLTVTYFISTFRIFKEKTTTADSGHGY